jgi:hypothetical protein
VPVKIEFSRFVYIALISIFISKGIIYDIIVEPPSIGSTMENGHSKPVSSNLSRKSIFCDDDVDLWFRSLSSPIESTASTSWRV